MTADCAAQKTCVVCDAPVRPLLDLAVQPPANLLLRDANEPHEAYPLGFSVCLSCTHGQLSHFVDPARLFRHYLYASGTSGTLKAYFDWFSQSLAAGTRRGARVLEIASNDGSLLASLEAHGFGAVGVDPAENLNRIATAAGRTVITGFFPDARPQELSDVIVAMNVAAHTPNPAAFMRGVRECLAPCGVAIIQTSQAMMIANGEFDTVYHEHYSFYTVASMSRLADTCGLRVDDVRLVSVHGVSMMFFLRRAEDDAAPIPFSGGPPFAVAWPEPTPPFLSRSLSGADALAAYAAFSEGAQAAMASAAALVNEHRASGRRVALVGVAAKALTFIRAAGITPDMYIDEAPLKVGMIVPDTGHVIEPLAKAAGIAGDTTFLIGAWNFAEELIGKIRKLNATSTPKFVMYFPKIIEIG